MNEDQSKFLSMIFGIICIMSFFGGMTFIIADLTEYALYSFIIGIIFFILTFIFLNK